MTRLSCPRVCVVVLNWNKAVETIECLESVEKSDYRNYEIIVVDNHSQDGSAQLIRERFQQHITLLVSESNLGYTGGNNKGIKYALKNGADYVWLLNNDTVVERNSLSELVKSVVQDERIGLVTPLIYFYDDRDRIEGWGREIDWAKNRVQALKIPNSGLRSENIKGSNIMVTGTALLIRKKVIDTIGYLDDSYFAYYEDDDYSLRSLKSGFVNQICCFSRIYHRAPPDGTTRPFHYYYYLSRNRFYFRSKHFYFQLNRLTSLADEFIHSFLLSGICAPGRSYFAVNASLDGAWAGFHGVIGPYQENVRMPVWLKRLCYPLIKSFSGMLILRRILIQSIDRILRTRNLNRSKVNSI